jgi:arabinofuranosyltransferase
MGGRFFTAPFLVAALLLAEGVARSPKPVIAAVVGATLLWGRWALEPLPVEPRTECNVPASGIVDERACYVEHTGISVNFRAKKYETHPYFKTGVDLRQRGERVVPSMIVGMAGYAAGPGVHLIDLYALTDPLLARITYQPTGEWRIGHFRREIPKGYVESLVNDDNRLEDPCLHALYDDLRRVTRGFLLSGARFAAIWRLNLGRGACPAPP